MLKQISINELCVDMYISEIIETPNIPMPKKKKGMIRDIRIITKFIEIGIQQVVIDIEKGLDIQDIPPANDSNSRPVYFDELIEEKITELRQKLSTNNHELNLEWGSAKDIFRTSARIVHQSISALRGGEHINIEYFNEAAKAISRSVLRNKDALTWLGKIRNEKNYLYEHSVNTAVLMGIFAKAQGLTNDVIEKCITGALLHDLGEAHINDEFFVRAGPLTPEEHAQVKEHVAIGESLLKNSPESSDIPRKIVRQHHERFDGSGYPRGLEGDEISIYGRMFAIVDTYDAVTNNRSYKEAIPSSVGMRMLLELSKTHFDEALVHQFIKCMGVYPTGSLVKLSNGFLAVVIAQNISSPIKPLVKIIYNTKSKAYVNPKMLNLSTAKLDLKILRYENPRDHDIYVNSFIPEEIAFSD
ncbi:MAG: putative nucleotidyltransferase with HDIG domain [Oleiphilaceae bacterium]